MAHATSREPSCGTLVRNPRAEPSCGTLVRNPRAEPPCGTFVRNLREEQPHSFYFRFQFTFERARARRFAGGVTEHGLQRAVLDR